MTSNDIRIAAATFALAGMLSLAACNASTTYVNAPEENRDRFEAENGVCWVITDTETGVKYLAWSQDSAGGITVLLDSDGRPVVDRHVAPDAG